MSKSESVCESERESACDGECVYESVFVRESEREQE